MIQKIKTPVETHGKRLISLMRRTPCVSTWLIILSFVFIQAVQGQQPEKPPRPISVTMFQNMNFGSIILGFSGGTVTMSPHGIRSVSGGGGGPILHPSGSGNAAVFEVKAPPGTPISLRFDTDPVKLSNGKSVLTLTFDPESTDPRSPFVTARQQGVPTRVLVGGTLNIPANSPDLAGNYIGTLHVTFIQE